MIMHFSKLVLKKEIIIIEMNQLFCNRVKALKYAVEDVLLLCNGDISKWSNSFARCVKIRNYRINSFRRELLEAVIAENVMNPKRLRRPGFYAPI